MEFTDEQIQRLLKDIKRYEVVMRDCCLWSHIDLEENKDGQFFMADDIIEIFKKPKKELDNNAKIG